MKRLISCLLALSLLLTGLALAEAQPTDKPIPAGWVSPIVPVAEPDPAAEPVPAAEPDPNALPDQIAMQKVVDALGADLIARGKAAGFRLYIDMEFFLDETDPTKVIPQIEIDLRSAVKSTWPENTVNHDLMYEIQCALLDANILGITDEESQSLKAYSYSPKTKHHDADYALTRTVNVHINETPSYEAILYLRHPSVYDRTRETLVWNSCYCWDELSRLYVPEVKEATAQYLEQHGIEGGVSYYK